MQGCEKKVTEELEFYQQQQQKKKCFSLVQLSYSLFLTETSDKDSFIHLYSYYFAYLGVFHTIVGKEFCGIEVHKQNIHSLYKQNTRTFCLTKLRELVFMDLLYRCNSLYKCSV